MTYVSEDSNIAGTTAVQDRIAPGYVSSHLCVRVVNLIAVCCLPWSEHRCVTRQTVGRNATRIVLFCKQDSRILRVSVRSENVIEYLRLSVSPPSHPWVKHVAWVRTGSDLMLNTKRNSSLVTLTLYQLQEHIIVLWPSMYCKCEQHLSTGISAAKTALGLMVAQFV